MMLHSKPLIIIVALTDHLADTFFRENVPLWRHYDVQKFEAYAILFREIQGKKMEIRMFKGRFQCGLG